MKGFFKKSFIIVIFVLFFSQYVSAATTQKQCEDVKKNSLKVVYDTENHFSAEKKIELQKGIIIEYNKCIVRATDNPDNPNSSDKKKKDSNRGACMIAYKKAYDSYKASGMSHSDAYKKAKPILDSCKTDKPVTTFTQDTKSTFSSKSGTLSDYCKDRKKVTDKGTGFITYDGGICDNIDKEGGYSAFIKMANKVIHWIVGISLMIAAAVGFFAGFKYVASAADPQQRSSAKSMLINVAVGILLIFVSWFIIEFIIDIFANSGSGGNFSGLEK